MTKTNDNVLEGRRCPECGWEADFTLIGTCVILVTDEGTMEVSDGDWDDTAHCSCGSSECDWHGVWSDLEF